MERWIGKFCGMKYVIKWWVYVFETYVSCDDFWYIDLYVLVVKLSSELDGIDVMQYVWNGWFGCL